FRPKNLKKVLLMGIGSYGSSDPLYIYRRLALMETVANFNSKDVFSWDIFHPGTGRSMAPYEVAYHNVNGGCGQCEKCKDGYCSYNDLMPFKFGDLEFHPRYEGKMMNYAQDHLSEFRQYFNEKTLFWIVGSKPDARVMLPYLKNKFGDLTSA